METRCRHGKSGGAQRKRREDIAPIRLTEDTKVKAPIAAAIRWKDIKNEADGNEKLLNGR